jgi:hypothetical protein
MEVKSIFSFLGCGRIGLLSSGSHHVRWVDVAGAQDRPLFVFNGTSRDSGDKQTDVLSLPLINPDVGFEPMLQLSWWHKQRCAELPTVCFQFFVSLDEQIPFCAIDL